MRNLLEFSRKRLELVDIADDCTPGSRILATCWDAASTDVLAVIVGGPDGLSLSLAQVQDDGSSRIEASWAASEPTAACNLHHFSDTLATILVLRNGDLVKIEGASVEIVGSVDGGITAASWSPDEEVIALCTEQGAILLMTRDFDPIHETNFSADDLRASKHVNVGWGKAETQFQGKGAKAMRDPTVPQEVDHGIASRFETGDVVISWRGDGAYFAVSRRAVGERRVVRTYSREGVLDSVSEPVDGLQHALSWRPSGNIICAVREINDQLDMVFFERNGLKHGGFLLNNKSLRRVNGLAWNSDSSILAVSFSDKTQFWTTGNYHWYLKLEFPTPECSSVCWHPENPQRFMISSQGLFTNHELLWTTSAGATLEPHDWGVISVTDGRELKLTPLRIANVPPPMSLASFPTEFVPRDTALSPSGCSIAALNTGGVTIIKWDFKKRPASLKSSRHIILDDSIHYRQTVFSDESSLCVLGDSTNSTSSITIISLQDESVSAGIPLGFFVATISPVPGQDAILCQGLDGCISLLNITSENVQHLFKLPSPCSTISGRMTNLELSVFALSNGGKLYANERLLASSVTSMWVSECVLAFVTSQHALKFVKLGSSVDDLNVPGDAAILDERCRNVERGARIVCVMPSIYSVVLQMPRGNLETIYPRALVLDGIRKSIVKKDYRRAFLTCRQHRVDLNILHDHCPDAFLRDIPTIISQLSKAEFIDLVLSQLRDEDVTVNMYPDMDASTAPRPAASGSTPGKVNKICEYVITYLREHMLSSHIQNIITAYCCKLPPDHEAALGLISSLKGSDRYDEAITHICFLADVNKLYDTALGTYDLELALTIAQRAQKDPREYLPFLQSLQKMEPLRRQFVIDDYLGRHKKALHSLHAMGDHVFSEVEQYVTKKVLYQDSLGLYRYDTEKLKKLTTLYADYLVMENRHREAGFAYENLGRHSEAAKSYKKAGLWRECLFSASQIPGDAKAITTQVQDHAQSLAGELIELKDYTSAAQINFDYLNNVSEGIRLLCRANKFSEAMRVASVHRQHSLLTEVIDPCLIDSLATASELLADCKSQLTAQTTRVLELREKKLEDPLAYFDGITDADAPDDVSLAPTNASTSASLFTRYTGVTLATALTGASRKTAKNRRKEERKRARGKKGSVYEEEYLLNSIRRLIERVNTTREETQHLVECLYRRGMRESAVSLQRLVVELMGRLEKAVEVMFPKVEGMGGRGEGVVGDVEEVIPVQTPPVLEKFESLSLV